MNPASRTAAVILAAGRSSRMGASKPLLPLGSRSVIERVVDSVSNADVGDIVVVTGHAADKVAPTLAGLPVREAHNAGYDAGMFSSVRTGARALRDDVQAFFILPVDYPLVRSQVLRQLLTRLCGDGPGILHPSCCGLRGHPPLLAGRYREDLLQADNGDNLRSFLARHRDDELEMDTEDLTILMDMDTVEDYQRICRFAALLDASDAAGAPHEDQMQSPESRSGQVATLTPRDALHLLSLLKVPDPVVRHCRTVAAVGETLAEMLKPQVPGLDVELVRAACLLHDMARTQPQHALVAHDVLANLGLSRLAQVVGAHMVLPPEQLESPQITEEQVVYLADKLVIGDRITTLEEKTARALSGREGNPAALEGARARMLAAQAIARRVASTLGLALEEVLPRA